jgi:hypothetical protein
MSPRRIKGNPMKFKGFYCSDELFKQMQDIAIVLNESDSEYIRKAVEQRNAKEKIPEKMTTVIDAPIVKKQENPEPKKEPGFKTYFKK